MKTVAFLNQLELLREEGTISAIDVEFCRFLQEVDPEVDALVLLAACLTSKAYQDGDVCIMLNDIAGRKLFEEAPKHLRVPAPAIEKWLASLKGSSVVGHPDEFKPLILDDLNRLYLQKQWQNEQNLVRQILSKATISAEKVDLALLADGINRLFHEAEEEVNWQKVAVAAAVLNTLTVISGGPGTGKTTTVVRLLALLLEQGRETGNMPTIALAAPTGKAAARLESSIQEALQNLQTDDEIKEAMPVECRTIHQLLGASRHTAHFRYNSENPLPCDYIIVDEVSMVDQALMSGLMNAALTKTKLLLLGDKDQLASVEAGSVLGDICGDDYQNQFSTDMQQQLKKLEISLPSDKVASKPQPLTDNVILLQKSYRFKEESGIGLLAQSINRGDKEKSLTILRDQSLPDVILNKRDSYLDYLSVINNEVTKRFKLAVEAGSPAAIFKIYNQFQILSPHRRGLLGTAYLNKQVENSMRRKGLISPYDQWYAGKPIIINQNDYTLGLSNGDLGVCVPDSDGNMKAFFNIDDSFVGISPSRLSEYSSAYVLTVHKSQGSEFDNIWLVLPQTSSKILSRELLYTAVTRARKSVAILGSGSVFCEGVKHHLARNSGLKDFLWSSA